MVQKSVMAFVVVSTLCAMHTKRCRLCRWWKFDLMLQTDLLKEQNRKKNGSCERKRTQKGWNTIIGCTATRQTLIMKNCVCFVYLFNWNIAAAWLKLRTGLSLAYKLITNCWQIELGGNRRTFLDGGGNFVIKVIGFGFRFCVRCESFGSIFGRFAMKLLFNDFLANWTCAITDIWITGVINYIQP